MSRRAARRALSERPAAVAAATAPGPLKYNFIRLGLRFFVSCYLRVRVEGARHLPRTEPYLICFSHPSWLDPILVVGFWPDGRTVHIFGPREQDMRIGRRNRLIRWARLGVPFRGTRDDLLDTTRRAVSVLRAGRLLAVAGEGRLSDRDGAIEPLQAGPAYFALRAGVPIVPLAIIGTRWIRFGKRIVLRIGPVIPTEGRRADRPGVADLTAQTQAALESLVAGVADEGPPGPFGRWISELFNERPWLDEATDGGRDESGSQRDLIG